MNRFLIPVIAVLVLIPVLIVGLSRDPSRLPSPYLDNPGPAYDLPSLTQPSERVSNESYVGEKALVNIWATWCVGCREEHPFLMELAAREILPIYGINWRDNRDDALRWLQAFGDPYVASGFDADGRVGIDWGAYGAPETFLVNEDGIVIHKHIGPLSEAAWQRDFMPLISEDPE